jgi:hypothetical protein
MSKKLLALALTLAMLLSLGTGAFAALENQTEAGGSGTTPIEGSNTIEQVILSVSLPQTLAFSLSPHQLGTITGSQVGGAPLQAVNKSDVPVQVRFDLEVKFGDGVTLVPEVSATPANATDNAKKIYFGAIAAANPAAAVGGDTNAKATFGYVTAIVKQTAINAFATGSASAYATNNGKNTAGDAAKAALKTAKDKVVAEIVTQQENWQTAASAFNTATTGAIVPATATAGTTVLNFGFALAGLGYKDLLGSGHIAASGGSELAAQFLFFGKLNEQAAWGPNDVTVKGNYTLSALGETVYDSLKVQEVANTSNLLVATVIGPTVPVSTVGFVGASRAGGTDRLNSVVKLYSKGNPGPVLFDFELGGLTVTQILLNDVTGATPLDVSTEYEVGIFDAGVLQIKIKGSKLNGASNGAKSGKITLSDGSTYGMFITIGD